MEWNWENRRKKSHDFFLSIETITSILTKGTTGLLMTSRGLESGFMWHKDSILSNAVLRTICLGTGQCWGKRATYWITRLLLFLKVSCYPFRDLAIVFYSHISTQILTQMHSIQNANYFNSQGYHNDLRGVVTLLDSGLILGIWTQPKVRGKAHCYGVMNQLVVILFHSNIYTRGE